MDLDWLNKLANGDSSDQTAPDTTDFSLAPTTPVKSNLMGGILKGIPGVSGYSPMQQDIPTPMALPEQDKPTVPAPMPEEEEKKIEKELPKKTVKKIEADEEDDDDEDELPKSAPQAPVNPEDYGTPVSEVGKQTQIAAPQAPVKKDPLADLISNLKDAQQRQQDMQRTAMILEGAQQVGAGLARQAPEKDYMKSLLEASKTPVQNVMQQADIQKAILGEQRANAELGLKQAAEAREGKKSDIQVQMLTQQLKDEKELNDPNSAASEAIRNTMAQRLNDLTAATNGKLKFDTSKLANLTGKQVQDLYGKMNPETVADTFVKTQATKEATAARLETAKQSAAARAQQQEFLNEQRLDAAEQRKRQNDTREQNTINNTFSKETKAHTDRIDAANRVQELIDKIRSGALVDSSNIRNTLTNDLSVLSLPTGSAGGVSDRDKTSIRNLNTVGKDLLSFVTSNPQKTIPDSYLKQMETETNALKDKYATAMQHRVKSLIAGTDSPRQKELYQNRYDEYMNTNNMPQYTLSNKQSAQPTSAAAPTAATPTLVPRKTQDGRIALFDPSTKQFVKYQGE